MPQPNETKTPPSPPPQNTTQPGAQPPSLARVGWPHMLLVVLCLAMGGVLTFLWQQKKITLLQETVENQQMTQMRQHAVNPSYSFPKDYYEFTATEIASFAFPNELNWEDSFAQYTVTGLDVGDFRAKMNAYNFVKANGEQFKADESAPALRLALKLKTPAQAGNCSMLAIRLINEEGDFIAPIQKQLYFGNNGGCSALPNTTYNDVFVFFPIEKNQTKFTIIQGQPETLRMVIAKNDTKKFTGQMETKRYSGSPIIQASAEIPISLIECRNEFRQTDPATSPKRIMATAGVTKGRCLINYSDYSFQTPSQYQCGFPESVSEAYLTRFNPNAEYCEKVSLFGEPF